MQTAEQNRLATPSHHQAAYGRDFRTRAPFLGQSASGDIGNLLAGVNMNMNSQRSGGPYGSIKGNMLANPADLTSLGRPYSGNQLMFPGLVLGTLGQSNAYSQIQYPPQEQNRALQYMTNNLATGYSPNPSMMPGPLPNYCYPYPNNGEVPSLAARRRGSWSSGDENGPGTPHPDLSARLNYQPAIAPMDRSPMAFYGMSDPSPSQLAPAMQLQMMKAASGGYVMQDVEALTQQDPPIPRAVPAMWTNPSDLTLSKCLENREGITNVYIRGFLPETTDEMLYSYAARFGKIERCKAIIDMDKGLCKGFGFVQYFRFDDCENCIRGFFHLGYQASFAQKSRNSRLKDLEDKGSSNIYCTNVPLDWAEIDLRRHFHPYKVVSEKISRDDRTGISKEVGFARFDSREIAEKVLGEFHNVTGKDGVKLLLRFADTKAQKQLKQQSNERRAYRAGEYNYSVECVQGSTPSPIGQHFQPSTQVTPASQMSFQSPPGMTTVWTPATSISPTVPVFNKAMGPVRLTSSWPHRGVLSNLHMENTPPSAGRHSTARSLFGDNVSAGSTKTVIANSPDLNVSCATPSPKKENIEVDALSPILTRKGAKVSTPKSVA